MAIEQRLKGYLQYVQQHEDPIVQTMALSLIPNERFQDEMANMTNWPYDPSIKIIFPLVNWFKNEFFKWLDQPDCSNCKAPTTEPYNAPGLDHDPSTGERIEMYRCSVCNRLERFQRYNRVEMLLDTKTGRCGEWANCFYLFLRALNLPARYVVDWTDHVWCEVYSKSTKQWLHIDPCEAAIDKPLLYEAGWSKQLSYVFGVNVTEIVDVTWRYVQNRKKVKVRRTECSEKELAMSLKRLNIAVQSSLPISEQKEWAVRRMWEFADFLTKRKVGQDEKLGRQSGSAQWRMSRGEAKFDSSNENFTISPSETERKSKQISISYNCALDKYERGSSVVGGWKTLTFESSNVFRKVERDWKKAYLCRNENSTENDVGTISWHFDLKGMYFF